MKKLNISENTSIGLPLRNLIGLISAILIGAWFAFGVIERLNKLETADTLFQADIPSGDVINFNFPEDGILFPKGIFCKTKTKVVAYTLLTDKFSGPNLTTTNG